MRDIKILIAEDESIAAEDLKRSLENIGYKVTAVTTTAEQTIQEAASLSPDLILMDIQLQGEKTGIDAATEILRTGDIPVVYLTAYADSATVQKAKASSPYGFVLKPFQIRELIGVVETALQRHRLESDLKSKEAWLSTALNSIGDGVISTDTAGRVTFMNPVAETLTGWTRQQALGKPLNSVFQIINEFTEKSAENPVEKVLRRGRAVGLANHTLLVRKDGQRIPIDDSGAPIRDEHGQITGVILVFKDISEKRKAERERSRLMEQYQSIINSNHNAIYLLDTDLNYLLMNQAYAGRLGLQHGEQPIGRAYSEFHTGKNTRQFAKRIETVLKSCKPVNYEYRSERDGRYFMRTLSPVWDENNGAIHAVTVISTDITQQRETEQALRESEKKYAAVFKNATDGLIWMNKDGIVQDINDAFVRITDIPPDQVIGKRAAALANKFVRKRDVPAILRRIASFISGVAVQPYELRYRNKILEIHSAVMHESGGYTATVRDITAQRHADRIQSVLFQISQATNQSENLDSLLKTIHEQLGQLMDTTNFSVVLYDEHTGAYDFPLMLDEHKKGPLPSPENMKHSLIEYVRRTGEPLLADRAALKKLAEENGIRQYSGKAQLWMGVPLKSAQTTFGVVAVQSYRDDDLYSESDLEVLTFISDHIATAIERKRSEEQIKSSLSEKDVLLKEIHHRVKNNLQIIQSLLGLQTQFIRDISDYELIKESQDRVRSIALVHENLYRSPNLAEIDFAEYIRNLSFALIRSYNIDTDRIRLHIQIGNFKFPVDRAVPCGLIVNELLTNALKYAFPPEFNGKGRIGINMKRINRNEVELIVEDNGVGLPDEQTGASDSLGLTLVKLLAEEQLKGRIKVDHKKGTRYTLTLNCPE